MRRVLSVGAVVALGTGAAVGYEVRFGPPHGGHLLLIVGVYLGAFAVTGSFAIWIAARLGLPSLLVLSPLPARRRWLRFWVYGIGLGIVIYLANRALYPAGPGGPLRPWYLDNLGQPLDVFLVSSRAALLEETLFRLFAIPFLVSLGMRAVYGWRPRLWSAGPGTSSARPPRAMVAAAVLVAAALFGFGHHPYSPLPATGWGVLLGLIYLRGGWESAVVAHFLGDYLLFAALYL